MRDYWRPAFTWTFARSRPYRFAARQPEAWSGWLVAGTLEELIAEVKRQTEREYLERVRWQRMGRLITYSMRQWLGVVS